MTSDVTWGWLVVLYLWMAGIAGGAYASAYMVHRLNGQRHQRLLRASAVLGLILLAVGSLLLILDLGRPGRFWHLFPQLRSPSVMWVGSYLLVLLSLIWAGLLVRISRGRPAGEAGDSTEGPLSALGFVLALVVIGYTGVLLAQARPLLWSGTLLVPWLFMASGLSTGIAALTLTLHFAPSGESAGVEQDLERLDATFIIIELVLLVLFLIWLAAAGPAGRAALGALIGGSMGLVFWIGLVVIGLLAPLVLEWRAVRARVTTPLMAYGAPVLVLLGGLLLRYVIVFAGQV